jgi:hypothetical protein
MESQRKELEIPVICAMGLTSGKPATASRNLFSCCGVNGLNAFSNLGPALRLFGQADKGTAHVAAAAAFQVPLGGATGCPVWSAAYASH